MGKIVEVLKEKKCLQTETPSFRLDPIYIVTDKDGRIFYSGAKPNPFKLKMAWCNYEVEAEGEVKVVAAKQEPPEWGFRVRPKAYFGTMVAEIFREGKDLTDSLDGGVMIDVLYWKDFNLNALVGVRSVGAGVGVDIFRSFGAYGGYSYSWDSKHSPLLGLWFAFW